MLFIIPLAVAAQHPSIMLTQKKVEAVTQGISQYPLLRASFTAVKELADEGLSRPVEVPVPKDGGGGYTHEQHKRNYQYILAAATAWQITKQAKYADFVKNILLSYASQYESWPLHPAHKSSNPAGRIFWQNLNDCVWQVYVIQGYDMVYDHLQEKDRNTIEQHLFNPIVKFLMTDNLETFDRIHNHGTWDVAAVGMTGFVLHKKEWAEKALHGSAMNDSTGFLAQVNKLFSPDGYYTEGPYYQRYALLPFLVFARAVEQYQPQLKIFSYNKGVLSKAIHTALQLTYTNGAFFPINDALKDKTFASEEIVYAVDLAYADIAPATDLLDVARHQGHVIISDAGLEVARGVALGKAVPFKYRSLWLKDGNAGDEGGLGLLREGSNDDQQCVLLKAAAQGMGHGHFDRLNFLYYDKGSEIFSDYGSARFLNIETKSGGDYLPENKTWAKQTIAHNTVVVDQTSHYKGDVDKAAAAHPELIYFSDNGIKAVAAKESNAYKDVVLTRALALLPVKEEEKPLVVDVFRIQSDKEHSYDLPYWYQGHITYTPFHVEANTRKLEPLGASNGYQHIWLNATGSADSSSASVTFLNNQRFYTTTFLNTPGTSVQFVTTGANDPNFNLRNEKGFILSKKGKEAVFISVIESHGNTNPTAETTTGFKGKIRSLQLLTDAGEIISFSFVVENKTYIVTLNFSNTRTFINIR